MLALTSHLPQRGGQSPDAPKVATEEREGALGSREPRCREMTRVGARSTMWADIFGENGDLIAESLRARAELDDVEARVCATATGVLLEAWITSSPMRVLDACSATRTRPIERADQPSSAFAYRQSRACSAAFTQCARGGGREPKQRGLRVASRLARVRRSARSVVTGSRTNAGARANALASRGLPARLRESPRVKRTTRETSR